MFKLTEPDYHDILSDLLVFLSHTVSIEMAYFYWLQIAIIFINAKKIYITPLTTSFLHKKRIPARYRCKKIIIFDNQFAMYLLRNIPPTFISNNSAYLYDIICLIYKNIKLYFIEQK